LSVPGKNKSTTILPWRALNMNIVIQGNRYFIPVTNGLKEITKAEAMDLYEKGEVTEVINYEHD
jgi:hypothetical protein